MQNYEITKTKDDDGFEIINFGYPNYTDLTNAEKRVLLLPLVEVIREFYKDTENRRKFEQWKAERYGTELTNPQNTM
jgi:hypothetical protein